MLLLVNGEEENGGMAIVADFFFNLSTIHQLIWTGTGLTTTASTDPLPAVSVGKLDQNVD